MSVFIFNYNYNEQSLRQLQTLVWSLTSNIDIYIDSAWEKKLNMNNKVNFCSFKEYLKKEKNKKVIYFNIIDGYKLLKYIEKFDLKLIFRPRGIVPEESFLKNGNKIKKSVLNLMERKVIKKTSFFIYISTNQFTHYLSKYQDLTEKLSRKIILSNYKYIELSNKKHSKDKNIRLVYSGGFSKWQNVGTVFKLVNQINQLYAGDILFFVYTFEKNHSKAYELAKKANIDDITQVEYIDPIRIDQELSKNDIGILIRDNNIVNQVASPFKIHDYLSNGLHLIVSDNIDNNIHDFLNKNEYLKVNFLNEEVNFSRKELESFIHNIFENNNKIKEKYDNFFLSKEKINLEIMM